MEKRRRDTDIANEHRVFYRRKNKWSTRLAIALHVLPIMWRWCGTCALHASINWDVRLAIRHVTSVCTQFRRVDCLSVRSAGKFLKDFKVEAWTCLAFAKLDSHSAVCMRISTESISLWMRLHQTAGIKCPNTHTKRHFLFDSRVSTWAFWHITHSIRIGRHRRRRRRCNHNTVC